MADENEEKPGVTVGVIGTGRGALEAIAGFNGHLGPLPGSDPDKDPVAKPPTLVGPHGRAWSVDPEGIRAKYGDQHDGQVSNWVIEAPWAHPLWHSYWLALVHLRPFPGMIGGTKLYRPDATHELWLYALSPDVPRAGFIERFEQPGFMDPVNFAAQIHEDSDAAAAARIEAAVVEVLAGKLSPDEDFRWAWATRFGDEMMRDRPGGQIEPTAG